MNTYNNLFLLFLLSFSLHTSGNRANQRQASMEEKALQILGQLLEEEFQELGAIPKTRKKQGICRGGNKLVDQESPTSTSGEGPATPFTRLTSVTPFEDELAHAVAMLILYHHDLDTTDPTQKTFARMQFKQVKEDFAIHFLRLGLLGLNNQSHKITSQQKQKEPEKKEKKASRAACHLPNPLKRSQSSPSLNTMVASEK